MSEIICMFRLHLLFLYYHLPTYKCTIRVSNWLDLDQARRDKTTGVISIWIPTFCNDKSLTPFALEIPKQVLRWTAKTQTNISSEIATGDPSIDTMENPVLTVSIYLSIYLSLHNPEPSSEYYWDVSTACVCVCVCVFRKFLELKGLNSCCPC